MASHHQITGWYSSLGVSEAARNTALHPTCGPLVWSCASHGTRATGHSSHENEITNMAGVFEHEKYPKLLFLLGGNPIFRQTLAGSIVHESLPENTPHFLQVTRPILLKEAHFVNHIQDLCWWNVMKCLLGEIWSAAFFFEVRTHCPEASLGTHGARLNWHGEDLTHQGWGSIGIKSYYNYYQ